MEPKQVDQNFCFSPTKAFTRSLIAVKIKPTSGIFWRILSRNLITGLATIVLAKNPMTVIAARTVIKPKTWYFNGDQVIHPGNNLYQNKYSKGSRYNQ